MPLIKVGGRFSVDIWVKRSHHRKRSSKSKEECEQHILADDQRKREGHFQEKE